MYINRWMDKKRNCSISNIQSKKEWPTDTYNMDKFKIIMMNERTSQKKGTHTYCMTPFIENSRKCKSI